jgi:non-specific serine/threonine protein kinase
MTGYDASEVLNKNCRFLQGEETNMDDVKRIGDAVRAGERITVRLLNYRKDGTKFWNLLTVAPVMLADGTVAKFIGVQVDVTTRTEGTAGLQGDIGGGASASRPDDNRDDYSVDAKGLPLLVKYDARLKDANQNRVDDVEQAVISAEMGDGNVAENPTFAPANRLARGGLDMATTLERIQQSFVIADPSLPDCPIVFASDGFLDFTGYTREEILGRNCRFLQGPRTDARAVREIRRAVDEGDECTVRLLNYTKQGKPFWNMFTLAPVRDETGKIRFFAGIQVDVTVYKKKDEEKRFSDLSLDSENLEDADPDRAETSFDENMKQYSKSMATQVSGAIADLADDELPWTTMVGRLGKPKPHQVGDPNWRALRSVVEEHRAAGRPARLTPDDFQPVKRLGHGDVGSVHLVRLRSAFPEMNGDGTSRDEEDQGSRVSTVERDATVNDAASGEQPVSEVSSSASASHSRPLFAMKVLAKQEMRDRNKLHRVKTEGTILEAVDHPFCATLYSAFQTETHLYFVMQFCEGGELYETLQNAPGKRFSERVSRFYAAEVLVALQYLHLMGFIYRDLKPENIMLRKDGHVVVTDFDLSYCASSRAHVVMLDAGGESERRRREGILLARGVNRGYREREFREEGRHDKSSSFSVQRRSRLGRNRQLTVSRSAMRHFERRFIVDARHRHRRVVVVFFERSFRRRVSAHRRRTFRVHELLRGHGGVPRARSSEQHGPHQLDRLVGVWHIHPRDGVRRHAVSRRPTRTDVPQHHPPAFGVSDIAGDFERTERFASQTVTKRPLAEARHERRRGGGEEPPVF